MTPHSSQNIIPDVLAVRTDTDHRNNRLYGMTIMRVLQAEQGYCLLSPFSPTSETRNRSLSIPYYFVRSNRSHLLKVETVSLTPDGTLDLEESTPTLQTQIALGLVMLADTR